MSNVQRYNLYLISQARGFEARRSAVERKWRKCRGRASREGRRTAQGGYFKRQAGCQVNTHTYTNSFDMPVTDLTLVTVKMSKKLPVRLRSGFGSAMFENPFIIPDLYLDPQRWIKVNMVE